MISTQLLGLQLLRALALMAAVSGMFIAVGLMPLADAITITSVQYVVGLYEPLQAREKTEQSCT